MQILVCKFCLYKQTYIAYESQNALKMKIDNLIYRLSPFLYSKYNTKIDKYM